jgi:AraC family transcriptional regulator
MTAANLISRPSPERRAEVAGFSIAEGMHSAGSGLPWHSHDGPSICFVLEGGFVEGFRGHSLDCRPAMLKITPAGDPHYNRFDTGDTRGILIEVAPERHQNLQEEAPILDERVHFQGGLPAVLARRVHQELRATDRAAPLVLEGLLLELIASAQRHRRMPRGPAPAWVVRARDILHARVAEGVSVSELAGEVGAHPVTLTRAFRRAYGCTVGEYLRRLRLDQATNRLSSTDLPLARIAVEAGFVDQSHFTNLFRRHTGMSPANYRRAVRS